jgi:hypothetical protein
MKDVSAPDLRSAVLQRPPRNPASRQPQHGRQLPRHLPPVTEVSLRSARVSANRASSRRHRFGPNPRLPSLLKPNVETARAAAARACQSTHSSNMSPSPNRSSCTIVSRCWQCRPMVREKDHRLSHTCGNRSAHRISRPHVLVWSPRSDLASARLTDRASRLGVNQSDLR